MSHSDRKTLPNQFTSDADQAHSTVVKNQNVLQNYTVVLFSFFNYQACIDQNETRILELVT